MTCYRPTTLRLAEHHCPRALDFYEAKRFAFRDHFSVGIAAHDCLAAVGEQTRKAGRALESGELVELCQKTMQRLITDGRTFEGATEPPLALADATEGRDLAIAWATEHPLSATAHYERGVAFDASWRQVPYADPTRRFRLIFDVQDMIEEEGEDYTGRVAVVSDYKTAWSTSETEISSWQMRAQSVAVWLLNPDVDGVRRELVNLRTRQTYGETLWLHDGGREQLENWRADLTSYMDALDGMVSERLRPARPGAGCMGCPWALFCEPAAVVASSVLVGDLRSADDVARSLGTLDATRSALVPLAKRLLDEEPHTTEAGLVGWHSVPGREPKTGAAAALYKAWTEAGGELAGFLAALPIGVTAIEGAAKRLHRDDKEALAALVESLTKEVTRAEFKVRRNKEAA